MQRLWDEFRRRNLLRVTAAYGVIAWVLVQGAAIVFPTFDMPNWTLKLLIIALILGLPVLLAGVWFAHPGGAAEGRTPKLRHTEWAVMGLLGAVLLATAVEVVWSPFSSAPAPTAAAPAPADASIAVLAFNNMSGDAGNEYFSEGISEELLNDLAQVPGLRVASRTSSFSFRNRNVTAGEIGRALNVSTVLEGSVRREGSRVRITAQLINAANGYHIWSQTYDREIADIFAVQDEISRAITRELTGRLLGTSRPAGPVRQQIDPNAYTAYLQGRFLMNRRNKDDMLRAAEYFKQAIAAAPDYADAHAGLGLTYALLYANSQSRDVVEPAKTEIAAALKLAPDNFTALVASAIVAQYTWDWKKADATLQRLLAAYPNSGEVHHFYADFLLALDMPDRVLAEHKRAVALDPLSATYWSNLATAYHDMGRDADAIKGYRHALALQPNHSFAQTFLCMSLAHTGDIAGAKAQLAALTALPGIDRFAHLSCEFMIAYREGNRAEARRLADALAALYQNDDFDAASVAFNYGVLGDVDKAMDWYEKAVDDHGFEFFEMSSDPYVSHDVKKSPRWARLMQRPEFAELAAIRAIVLARNSGG